MVPSGRVLPAKCPIPWPSLKATHTHTHTVENETPIFAHGMHQWCITVPPSKSIYTHTDPLRNHPTTVLLVSISYIYYCPQKCCMRQNYTHSLSCFNGNIHENTTLIDYRQRLQLKLGITINSRVSKRLVKYFLYIYSTYTSFSIQITKKVSVEIVLFKLLFFNKKKKLKPK